MPAARRRRCAGRIRSYGCRVDKLPGRRRLPCLRIDFGRAMFASWAGTTSSPVGLSGAPYTTVELLDQNHNPSVRLRRRANCTLQGIELRASRLEPTEPSRVKARSGFTFAGPCSRVRPPAAAPNRATPTGNANGHAQIDRCCLRRSLGGRSRRSKADGGRLRDEAPKCRRQKLPRPNEIPGRARLVLRRLTPASAYRRTASSDTKPS